METRRWVNQNQPQTLYMGTILLYLHVGLSLLFGRSLLFFFGPLGLLLLAALVAGAYGIANDQRWGWRLAVAITGLQLGILGYFLVQDLGLLFELNYLIASVVPVALFLLLVHPLSRQYERIWFS
jgi:hypothetical protein